MIHTHPPAQTPNPTRRHRPRRKGTRRRWAAAGRRTRGTPFPTTSAGTPSPARASAPSCGFGFFTGLSRMVLCSWVCVILGMAMTITLMVMDMSMRRRHRHHHHRLIKFIAQGG